MRGGVKVPIVRQRVQVLVHAGYAGKVGLFAAGFQQENVEGPDLGQAGGDHGPRRPRSDYDEAETTEV